MERKRNILPCHNMLLWLHFSLCLLLFFVLFIPSSVAAYSSRVEKKIKECNQASKRNDVRCLEFRGNMARIEYGDNEKGRKEAERLYKKALVIKPNDLSVLDNLSRLYAKQKRYQESLDLINRYIALQPSNIGVGMYRCMLWERMKYPKRDYMNCYKIVAQRYRKKKVNNINYVFAMILAAEPGAEKFKHAYIDNLKPGSSDREMWEHLLRNADRKKLLDEMIP